MNCPNRLTSNGIAVPARKVLLDSRLPTRLLRHLDGWSPLADQFLEFADLHTPLAERASDSLDWAVISVSAADDIETILPALLRVARQGLIRFF